MPLSQPAERTKLHTRSITIHGYERTDGLFDIEAHITDTKTTGIALDDHGYLPPGEPLHEMWMRMTVDDRMTIVACEAATEHGPYAICPQAAPAFGRLAGLTIRGGFLKAAMERVGGVAGCTHLRELLQQMATTALQTMFPRRARREMASQRPPALLNTCLAWSSDSPVIRRRWPHLYTGPEPLEETRVESEPA